MPPIPAAHWTAVLKAVLALLRFGVTIIRAVEVVGFSNDYYYGPIGMSLPPRSEFLDPSNHSPMTKYLASARQDYITARPPFVRGNKRSLPSQRVTLATANGARIVTSITLWPGYRHSSSRYSFHPGIPRRKAQLQISRSPISLPPTVFYKTTREGR